MTDKPTACPYNHILTWYGNYAVCEGPDAMVLLADGFHPHTKYWHWTPNFSGVLGLCQAESSVRPLLDRIIEQEGEIARLTQRFAEAAAQDYCSMCGGILDSYQGDERNARIAALEAFVAAFDDWRHWSAMQSSDFGSLDYWESSIGLAPVKVARTALDANAPTPAPESAVPPVASWKARGKIVSMHTGGRDDHT